MIHATPIYTLGSWRGNVTDEFGVDWMVTKEDGWSSGPPVRPVQEEREAGDGDWSGPGRYGARVISLSGSAVAPDRRAMLSAKERIKAAIGPRIARDLIVEEEHLTRRARVRLTDQIALADAGARAFTWDLIVTAADPRRYALQATIGTTGLPATGSTGRVYDRVYPVEYGGYAPGGPGAVRIRQAGDFDQTPARIVIQGPVASPRVTHAQTHRVLAFNLTIPSGQYLEIDLAAQTALLNGTSSRVAALTATSAWWWLVPGDNEIQFRGVDVGQPSDPAPVMTVTASSAWT